MFLFRIKIKHFHLVSPQNFRCYMKNVKSKMIPKTMPKDQSSHPGHLTSSSGGDYSQWLGRSVSPCLCSHVIPLMRTSEDKVCVCWAFCKRCTTTTLNTGFDGQSLTKSLGEVKILSVSLLIQIHVCWGFLHTLKHAYEYLQILPFNPFFRIFKTITEMEYNCLHIKEVYSYFTNGFAFHPGIQPHILIDLLFSVK